MSGDPPPPPDTFFKILVNHVTIFYSSHMLTKNDDDDEFEPVQNLISDFVERSCAAAIWLETVIDCCYIELLLKCDRAPRSNS